MVQLYNKFAHFKQCKFPLFIAYVYARIHLGTNWGFSLQVARGSAYFSTAIVVRSVIKCNANSTGALLTRFIGLLRENFAIAVHVHVQGWKNLRRGAAIRIKRRRGLENKVQVADKRPFHDIAAASWP